MGDPVGVFSATRGEVEFVELRRVRTQRVEDKASTFRWYNHFAQPDGGAG